MTPHDAAHTAHNSPHSEYKAAWALQAVEGKGEERGRLEPHPQAGCTGNAYLTGEPVVIVMPLSSSGNGWMVGSGPLNPGLIWHATQQHTSACALEGLLQQPPIGHRPSWRQVTPSFTPQDTQVPAASACCSSCPLAFK
jgi:hypothetical protein